MRSHFSYYSLHTKLLQNQFTHCTYPLTSSNVATHFQHATFILNTLYPPPPPLKKKKNIKLSAVPCFPILNSSRLSRQESTFSTASRTAEQFSSNLSLPYSISFCLPFSECLQTLKNPFLHRATGYLCSTAMFRNMWIYLWCNQRLL